MSNIALSPGLSFASHSIATGSKSSSHLGWIATDWLTSAFLFPSYHTDHCQVLPSLKHFPLIQEITWFTATLLVSLNFCARLSKLSRRKLSLPDLASPFSYYSLFLSPLLHIFQFPHSLSILLEFCSSSWVVLSYLLYPPNPPYSHSLHPLWHVKS